MFCHRNIHTNYLNYFFIKKITYKYLPQACHINPTYVHKVKSILLVINRVYHSTWKLWTSCITWYLTLTKLWNRCTHQYSIFWLDQGFFPSLARALYRPLPLENCFKLMQFSPSFKLTFGNFFPFFSFVNHIFLKMEGLTLSQNQEKSPYNVTSLVLKLSCTTTLIWMTLLKSFINKVLNKYECI